MGLTAVAIHNEERGRMVATELNALAKVTGAPKVQAIARLFHSAPVITGERCEREIGDLRIKRGFNPRPPSLASGARHTDTGGMPTACFNPRPPSLASGARAAQGHGIEHAVSIHARHRWRAVRVADGLRRSVEVVSIHARHRWRAVLATSRSALWHRRFQSTPAIAGERCPPSR